MQLHCKTWPQSNYTKKQEEPFRLIWLLHPGLPQQLQRDAQEGVAVWVGSTWPCAPWGPARLWGDGHGAMCLALGSCGSCLVGSFTGLWKLLASGPQHRRKACPQHPTNIY